MSTSLVINIAFCVGVILSYKLLKGIITKALKKKRSSESIGNCSDQEFQRRVMEYYKHASKEYNDLNGKVEALFKDVYKSASDIIERNKKRMNEELSNSTTANAKQVSDQVAEAKKELKAHTADIAAKVAAEVMKGHQNGKRKSEVISSLSRDLSKKLH